MDYISLGRGWLLLSTVKSGTENRLCNWKEWYHMWGVYDDMLEA